MENKRQEAIKKYPFLSVDGGKISIYLAVLENHHTKPAVSFTEAPLRMEVGFNGNFSIVYSLEYGGMLKGSFGPDGTIKFDDDQKYGIKEFAENLIKEQETIKQNLSEKISEIAKSVEIKKGLLETYYPVVPKRNKLIEVESVLKHLANITFPI